MVSLDELTVIMSTSPVPSNPSTKYVDAVVRSLRGFVIGDAGCQILIAADGPRDHKSVATANYAQFLNNLSRDYRDDSGIHVATNPRHGNLSGNLRNAVQYVAPDTRYLLIVQHDLVFVRPVNVLGVLQDMEELPNLKHVRFNKRNNIATGWDNTPRFAAERIARKCNYISTECWSENNHVCRVEYLRDTVLSQVPDGVFMESELNDAAKGKHDTYGTYIYGCLDEPNTIVHVDAAETRSGEEGAQCRADRERYV